MLLLSSEYSPPPRPPNTTLLSLSSSGPGFCPTLLLLGRLGRSSRLSESVQLSTEVVTLAFGLFAPAALLVHPLVQRALRHLAAGPLGAELLPDLFSLRLLLDRLGRFSRLPGGLQLAEPVRKDGRELLLALEGGIPPADLLRS